LDIFFSSHSHCAPGGSAPPCASLVSFASIHDPQSTIPAFESSGISNLIQVPLVPFAIAILWLHYFWCLVPSWTFGEYYNYGFLVPFLVFGFAWRRADLMRGTTAAPWIPGKFACGLMTAAAVTGLFLIIPLRIIETGDPGWRPPIILHGLLVTVATHLALARWRGWKVSSFFLPVTVFAWTAVPYFWQLEQILVRQLTGLVIGMTQEVFLLSGQPVERLGERLTMGGQVCEVTDGCSGIRSIQSLVMAALFFGELLWLHWSGRLALVGIALVAAVLCNAWRAWHLASVQFHRGEDAARAAHDTAGHLAFAAAALILFIAARCLMPRARRRFVTTRVIGGERFEMAETVSPSGPANKT
jgi:exosortase